MAFLWFFYDFGEFCNISVFIEKEKNERKRKRKRLAWAWSSPQWSRPNCKDSTQVEKQAHQERLTRIWTFCIRNSDIFQKLLRSSYLFFLSSIFTSGTPYFFLFSSLLLISIGNENETEPVIGGGRGRKKNCGNSAFLLLDKDIIKPLSVIRWRLVCCIMPTF